jgi:chemotaxis protein CheX
MTCEAEVVTLPDIGCAIRQATTEVFSVMLGIDVEPGNAQATSAGVDHSGVVAVLGLTGAWGGSGEISCDSGLSMEIARRLLMSECSAVDEEVLDAVAEVANMIVGNIKTHLEQALGPMGLSTPAVFFGGDFETRVVGRTTRVLVPFTCADGSLTVQIAIAPMARTRLRHRD